MRIVPLDIIQKEFTSNKKGYDPDEVSVFLDEVRETLETVLRDNQKMKMEMGVKEEEIGRLKENESEITQTLVVARKFAEDLNGQARRESDLLLGEARLEAQRIMSQAHDEHRELLQEVIHLKGVKVQLLSQLRAVTTAHLQLLDDLEEVD